MRTLAVVALALFAVAFSAGCKDLPGADGRYATHDHGQNNRGSP
ncbi:hypothetical protein [Reyranella sp.]|jgi:hypothetical protein